LRVAATSTHMPIGGGGKGGGRDIGEYLSGGMGRG